MPAPTAHRMRMLLVVGVCLTAACELSDSDLAAYSHTAAGPQKIQVVVEEARYDDALRAEAVVTLLDLSRDDVDGVTLAFESLSRVPQDSRNGLLLALLSRLRPRIEAGSPASEAEQVETKDALTRLAALSRDPEVRSRYGQALIGWYAADLEGRTHAGRSGIDALVRELTTAAAGPLTEALEARSRAQAVAQLAALLDAIARGEDRARAAKRLLDVEARWRSEGRLLWLEAELRRSKGPKGSQDALAAEAAAEDAADALRKLAEAQREQEIEHALLPALGRFADVDAVASRLLAIAASEGSVPVSERELALVQLAEHTRPDQVGALLELSSNLAEPEKLRELALTRAAEHADSQALPQLLAIMNNRKERALRQKAAELVLEVGGEGGLSAFFRAMPKAWAVDFSRSELEAYAERMGAIEPEPHIMHYMGAKMYSPYWWARVLALRYYARRAREEELWRMRQHIHDYTLVRGSEFPDGYTIGQEAQAAVAMALRRLRGEG